MPRRTITQRNAATPAPSDLTPAMEDYLKAIVLIGQQGIPVTTRELARYLSVAPPSVTEMVKRLAEHGFVIHTPYRPITLTGTGEQLARELVERYQLVVRFLVTRLGYSDVDVDQEADRLEHAVSGRLRSCIAACGPGDQ